MRNDYYGTSELSQCLRGHALTLGVLSTSLHVFSDGLLSLSLIVSLLYITSVHYGSSYSNKYAMRVMKQKWRRQKTATLLKIFATTFLSILRIAFLSINNSTIGTMNLYLAYLQLFIEFSDNFAIACILDQPDELEHEMARLTRRPRVAPAG